jgi:chromosome segregation ATPase
LWKQHDKAVVEVARLRAERDPLDKVLNQRRAEYERSRTRHADFPSVVELQKRHTEKYGNSVRSLDEQIQKAQHIVDSTARSIVLASLSVSQSKPQATPVAAPAVSPHQQEISKKQQTEISELKSKLGKIEAEQSQERSDLKAEFERQCAEMKQQMKEQMEEMVKGMKDMKEVKTMKKIKEETVAEVKEQLRVMRKELDDRRSKSPDTVSSAQVATLVERESSALKSDIAGLLKRVDELTGQLAQHTKDTASLRNDLAACTRRVDEEAGRVEEHETKLSSLDIGVLEEASETTSIKFPALERTVEGIQAKLDGLNTISPQEVDTKQEAFFRRVEEFVVTSGEELGGMVDEAQKDAAKLAARIKALEDASASTSTLGVGGSLGQMVDEARNAAADHAARIKALEEASTRSTPTRRGTDTGPSQTAKTDFEIINSDLAWIKSEFGATKTTVNRLSRDVSKLVSEDLNNQLAALRHIVLVMDTQFNNLTTKELAESILGQLEQIYPNAGQLTADVEALEMRVGSIAGRLDGVEGRMEDFKSKPGSFADDKAFDMSILAGRQDCFNGELDELMNGPNPKRRRIDSGVNSVERPVAANGSD